MMMYICHYDNSNFDVVSIHLPLEIKMKMESMFVNEDSGDILIWGSSMSSIYTTKSILLLVNIEV